MKPIDDKVEKVTIRAISQDEEGKKRVERVELATHDIDTVKYVEKKLVDKGVAKMERHPTDGLPFKKEPPKSGHGGKYTWEGPVDEIEAEMDPAPTAVDERDPNFVEEEVPEGVARVDFDPRLNV